MIPPKLVMLTFMLPLDSVYSLTALPPTMPQGLELIDGAAAARPCLP